MIGIVRNDEVINSCGACGAKSYEVDEFGHAHPNGRLLLDIKVSPTGNHNWVTRLCVACCDELREKLFDALTGRIVGGPPRTSPPLTIDPKVEEKTRKDLEALLGKAGEKILAPLVNAPYVVTVWIRKVITMTTAAEGRRTRQGTPRRHTLVISAPSEERAKEIAVHLMSPTPDGPSIHAVSVRSVKGSGILEIYGTVVDASCGEILSDGVA